MKIIIISLVLVAFLITPVFVSAQAVNLPYVCAGITFARNLTVGSSGMDVQCLQAILNTSTATQVAASGVGSPGNETTYFGPATLAAVQKYQEAQGWNPGTGVGSNTRAALNALLSKASISQHHQHQL